MSSLIDSEALHSGSEDEYSEEEQLYTDHDMDHFIDNGNYDDDEFYANPLVNKKDEEESQRVAQQLNKKILAYEQQNKAPYPISPITLSQETQEQTKQKEIQQYVKAVTTTTGASLNKTFKPISKRIESKWRTEKSKHVQKKRGGSSFVLARLRQRKSKQTNTYKKKVTKMMYLKPSVEKKKKSTSKASSSNMMFGGYTGQCVTASRDPYDLL